MARLFSMTRSSRRWLWLGASGIILLLVFYNLARSPEWRRFRWDQFWSTVAHAHLRPLFLALIGGLGTYVIRAYRWKYFLRPIKRASLWVLFAGQIFGFSAIYLIGRAGEFVRPAYIARKENVPFSVMAAIWLLERIFDSAFLILFFAVALSMARIRPTPGRGEWLLIQMHHAGRILLAVTAVAVVGLVIFRLRAEQLTARLISSLRFLPDRAQHHIEHFVRSFADGLEVIHNWRDFLASVAITLLLWGVNTTVFWLVFGSLGEGLKQLSWMAAALVMICAALGLVIQFPGIGGGYQVGTILALTQIFSVRPEIATGAGIMVWILTSMPCVALGLILLVHEGMSFKKLDEIAEQERAATVEKI